MTPERQKWWDSLPKEEKRVRQDIKRLMDDIYYDYPPKYCEDCGQKLRWA